MTLEQHLQQLIGSMGFQLAQASATIDALNVRVAELEAKPKRVRKATSNGLDQNLDSSQHGSNGSVPNQPKEA